MRKQLLYVVIFVMGWVLSAHAQGPKKTYTVDDLMPNARLYVRSAKDVGEFKPAMELKPGQKVVFVGDYTVDPLVVEAVTRAIRSGQTPEGILDSASRLRGVVSKDGKTYNGAEILPSPSFAVLPEGQNRE